MELYERMLAGGGVAPSFDPEADARQASQATASGPLHACSWTSLCAAKFIC